jgi:hypothetical protein
MHFPKGQKDTQPAATSVDNQFTDMSRFLPTHPRCAQHRFFSHCAASVALAWLIAAGGCGAVICPEPLIEIDGTCYKLDPVTGEPERAVESCDGVDNDGDDEVDEDWPELGEACGEGAGVGTCIGGKYVCAEGGAGVVCEGALGPGAEVCDGKDNDCDGTTDNGPPETCDGEDNDCDGLVDEGVLSVEGEVFAGHATVTALDGGFAVTRVISDQLRVETYDTSGNRTGLHDDIESPGETAFLQSDSAGSRVLVALGKRSFHVVEAHVDSDLVPIIVATQELHEDWDQPTGVVEGFPVWGVSAPPFHPRVLASPNRFVGYRDLGTFALNPFANDDLLALTHAPTVAMALPIVSVFDVAESYVVWEQGDNLRAGLLADGGTLLFDLDVARGHTPGIAAGMGALGMVYVQSESLRLTELGGLPLQCLQGRFCNERIEHEDLQAQPAGPTALALDEVRDVWFIVAGAEAAVVGRTEAGAVVVQAFALDALGEVPNRVDVAVSGGTAAVVQADKGGDSALTFLGCF